MVATAVSKLQDQVSTEFGEIPQQLHSAIVGYSNQQLLWASGFLAGLAQSDTPTVAEQPSRQPTTAETITILFGSQTGNGEGLARDLDSQLTAAGYRVELINLKDYRAASLKKARYVVLVVSTHGEGDAPDDAEDFYEFLFSQRAPELAQLSYAVLALGDSSYEQFCATGAQIDARLAQLGARRLVDRIDCDVDYQPAASQWASSLHELIDQELAGSVDAAPVPLRAVPDTLAYSEQNPARATVSIKQKLTSRDSSKDVRHLELSLDSDRFSYQPGDALAVIASNDPTLVERLCSQLGLDPAAKVTGSDHTDTTLRQALTEQFEITRLTRPVLKAYAELCQSPAMAKLLEDADSVRDYLDRHHLVDLVTMFPCQPSPQYFVDVLRRLTPREYSIASSQAIYDDEVHLTIAPVRFPGTDGSPLGGIASTFLVDRLNEGDEVQVFLKPNSRFRLPEDTAKPVIMIGPGTGIAPFRAFLQQREADGATGNNWLFFGDREQRHDFLYQTEWQNLLRTGLLTRLDVAFSRDQPEKIYVQDRLLENAPTVFEWIEQGAHIYVCGDSKRMAKDVEKALQQVIAEAGGLTEAEAADYLKQLRRSGRYQKDVY